MLCSFFRHFHLSFTFSECVLFWIMLMNFLFACKTWNYTVCAHFYTIVSKSTEVVFATFWNSLGEVKIDLWFQTSKSVRKKQLTTKKLVIATVCRKVFSKRSECSWWEENHMALQRVCNFFEAWYTLFIFEKGWLRHQQRFLNFNTVNFPINHGKRKREESHKLCLSGSASSLKFLNIMMLFKNMCSFWDTDLNTLGQNLEIT